MRPMAGLLTIQEALAEVLGRVQRAAVRASSRSEAAAGRVLAEDVRSRVDLPPFRSSAMDGFAVRAADLPGSLPVVSRIAAGRPADRPLEPGEAMGIATGGTVPDGADAVVPIELVSETDNSVEIPEPVAAGAHVRPVGGDVRAGDALLPAGTRLGAAQIGALAAAGSPRSHASGAPRSRC